MTTKKMPWLQPTQEETCGTQYPCELKYPDENIFVASDFSYLIYFISNQNLQFYELICWRKRCDAL
jgi:hypothetical protein